MNRHILLLEPNYRNKYPPMGLMKLAMYHRLQGDNVVFYKGALSAFVLSQIVDDAVAKLSKEDNEIDWSKYTPEIKEFVQHGKTLPETAFEQAAQRPYATMWLKHFREFYKTGEYYKKPCWDRVCVTTLFTFYWDITIETIEFAKKVCKNQKEVLVGGILASVVPDQVETVTGIRPHIGCLNKLKLQGDKPLPHPFDKTPIDELPLDYSILEEIEYRYPATDAYFAYATRGCVNKCSFCAVPVLEPNYKEYIPLRQRLNETRERFGEQRHLLLLDNNVFASKKFDKIIDEIRDSGFAKGATFVPPSALDVAIRLLREKWNDRAYIKLTVRLLNEFVKKLEGDEHDTCFSILYNSKLLNDYTAVRQEILTAYDAIKDIYEKHQSKRPLVRFVDFNQGMDARLATPEKMTKLAEVAIRPLRIAFDNWGERKHYVKAVKLAKDNNILQLSNYLLYNFTDKPVDLYRRLLLNIDLCDELGVNIYSFPMKYHPIMDSEWFSNRDYIGEHWTRKAIRTVQAVLNSTHGKIGRGRTFFFKAFGRDEDEFEKLLKMPEAFIIKRWDAEISGLTKRWHSAYQALDEKSRRIVDNIVATNKFQAREWRCESSSIRKVLGFYLYDRDAIPVADEKSKRRFIEFFEKSCTKTIAPECDILVSAIKNCNHYP